MRRIAVCLAAWAPLVPFARAEEPLVEQVRAAIDRGIRFLKADISGRNNWESGPIGAKYTGGMSGLSMLALLNSGVKPDDPIIQRGLTFMRGIEPQYTYVVGLQTMVLAEVGEARDLPRIQRNVDWLIDARRMDGEKLLGWGYGPSPIGTDFSNSQYALLGLHAGRVAGAKIDRAVWQSIQDFYTRLQDADGGWIYSFNYNGGRGGTQLTMTVAGLCGLYIASAELDAGKRTLNPDGSDPKCGVYPENAAIARALKWLATEDGSGGTRLRFDERQHPFYNIYGIERAGRLSGQRILAGHDWYRDGCDWLVRKQQEDGSWFQGGSAIDGPPVISTSFALLFLSKGRTPILVSKFAYGTGTDWNNKHSDARHMVEYASKELFKKQPLAWQVYDVRTADIAGRDEFMTELGTLLQSPILYMNGHAAPKLTEVQKRLLKQYIDEGGFVFAEACCGRKEFAVGFRALMAELYPDTPLKPLGPDHPIWIAHAVVPPNFVNLEGVELGCKTVVVFSPQPLAGYWETDQRDEGRGKLAFRLAGNVIAYATGLEMPKPRLTNSEVIDVKDEKRSPRGFLKVAQIRHDGDWQPAPRAMPTLMRHLRTEAKLDVDLKTQELRMGERDLFDFKFLYMHGRRKFETTPDDIENLRANLKTGGLLFADACCGKKEFDTAFREFAAKLFPDAKLEPIPLTDFLYSAEVNGKPITTVRVRREKPDGSAEAEFRDAAPYLEGISVNGRWVVIYSKYDIGCALEKHQSSDCKGHDNASALRLGSAVVLYALKK